MQQIAIVGASGGIGQALAAWCVQRWPGASIWASYRTERPQTVVAPTIRWLPMNLEDDRSIGAFVEQVSAETDNLDLLLICSGWLHDQDHMPEKSVRDLNTTAFARAMRINATAPMILVSQLSDLLTRHPGSAASRAGIVVLSAKVGSIGDNSLGGWHAYRMSKAALNMGIKNLGIEFARNQRKPVACAVHPGTTHSNLSAPFAKRGLNVVAAQTAGERLGHFVENLAEQHQGGFFHWDGTPIPW